MQQDHESSSSISGSSGVGRRGGDGALGGTPMFIGGGGGLVLTQAAVQLRADI